MASNSIKSETSSPSHYPGHNVISAFFFCFCFFAVEETFKNILNTKTTTGERE